MKYAIIVNSKTGNTRMLANQIQSSLQNHTCVYMGDIVNDEIEADIIFTGFWTDKGCCHEEMSAYLKTLHHQKLFLFGTCGFGKDTAYYDRIIENVKQLVPHDNEVIASYMCQGKMPMLVRQRYESMAAENPDMQAMIENFDQALAHPNEADLAALDQAVAGAIADFI